MPRWCCPRQRCSFPRTCRLVRQCWRARGSETGSQTAATGVGIRVADLWVRRRRHGGIPASMHLCIWRCSGLAALPTLRWRPWMGAAASTATASRQRKKRIAAVGGGGKRRWGCVPEGARREAGCHREVWNECRGEPPVPKCAWVTALKSKFSPAPATRKQGDPRRRGGSCNFPMAARGAHCAGAGLARLSWLPPAPAAPAALPLTASDACVPCTPGDAASWSVRDLNISDNVLEHACPATCVSEQVEALLESPCAGCN